MAKINNMTASHFIQIKSNQFACSCKHSMCSNDRVLIWKTSCKIRYHVLILRSTTSQPGKKTKKQLMFLMVSALVETDEYRK